MIIRKGKHNAQGQPLLALRWDFSISRRRVWFDTSCRYEIGKDQTDINKLYGVAYLSWAAIAFVLKSYWTAIVKRSLAEIKSLHHYNSARFGWAYNPLTDKIDIYSYCYHNGERTFQKMASIGFYKYLDTVIERNGDRHDFRIYNSSGLVFSLSENVNASTLGYELFLYFGGNIPAPHDMQIALR